MLRVLLVILFLASYTPVLAQVITTQTPYNYGYGTYPYNKYQPYHHNYHHASVLPKSDLTALERYALKKNYSRESDIRRLERLEDLAFGSIQTGDLITRYRNVENAILARPQNNFRNSLINTIGNYFSGQTTGFTPSLNSNFMPGITSGFVPSYGNTRYDEFSNGIFGHGFRVNNQNYGTGSNIHLLD